MEPKSRKRKPQGNPSHKPGKKTKTSAPITTKPKKRSSERRAVDASALPWKTDPDGFEVLEGVEVVRNGGKVEFMVPESAFSGSKAHAGAEEVYDDDDAFEGFDDTPAEYNDVPETTNAQRNLNREELTEAATKKGRAKELKKSRKAKGQHKNENTDDDNDDDDDLLTESNFSALADVADDDTDMTEWAALDLSPQVLSAIANIKFSKPTAIQSGAIPHILAGHDVIGKASTGSGKTLAFAIPIVEKWLADREEGLGEETNVSSGEEGKTKTPLALVLSPTRELAHQLVNHVKDLCDGLPRAPYVCSITGGLSVHKQQRQLTKADIVVGTPGRLWEVLSSSPLLLQSFRKIMFLVVDEADRLLSEGHFAEAEEILNALDRQVIEEDYDQADDRGGEQKLAPRQTLVFSATFNKALQQKLAGKGRYNLMDEEQSLEYLLKKLNFREERPKFIDVNPVSQMAEGLKEGLVECGAMEKDLYLYAVLMLNPCRRTLVFTNSITAVRRVTPMLTNLNLKAHPLHSQMPQKARLRSIERFTAQKDAKPEPTILVATDVAARGLDIPNVDMVVHYHVPRAADAYVHRSGRTARGTNEGISILLCAPEEVVPTRRLVAKVHAEKASRPRKHTMRTVDVDRKIATRLKPRVTLAKKIADAYLAKEKVAKEEDWAKTAAEELGVDYDEEDVEWGGRGSSRKQKEKEAVMLTRNELGALKARLREMLAKRVNAGVSERYITGGNVDVDALLRNEEATISGFLGRVGGLMGDE